MAVWQRGTSRPRRNRPVSWLRTVTSHGSTHMILLSLPLSAVHLCPFKISLNILVSVFLFSFYYRLLFSMLCVSISPYSFSVGVLSSAVCSPLPSTSCVSSFWFLLFIPPSSLCLFVSHILPVGVHYSWKFISPIFKSINKMVLKLTRIIKTLCMINSHNGGLNFVLRYAKVCIPPRAWY